MSLAAGMASLRVVQGLIGCGRDQSYEGRGPCQGRPGGLYALALTGTSWRHSFASTYETTDPVAPGIHQGNSDALRRDRDPGAQAGAGRPRGRLQARRPDRV